MKEQEVDDIRFSRYSQVEDVNLPKELLDECLDIIENVEGYKSDSVNWEERAKMDEISRRSGSTLFDETSEASTLEYLEADSNKKTKKGKIKKEEIKPTNEKEEALMSGLADVLGKIDELDEQKNKGGK